MNSKTNKGFILPVLIIIGVLVLGIVAYFFSPKSISSLNVKMPTVSPIASSDPTLNWKTYFNKDYGFEFQYPSNWSISCENNTTCELVSNTNSDKLLELTTSHLVIEFYKPNISYSNFVEFLKYFSNEYDYSFKDKKINNIEGKINLMDKNMLYYFFEAKGVYVGAVWKSSGDSNLTNEILSTFKFIE